MRCACSSSSAIYFWPYSLCTEIPPDSPNLLILCTEDDEKSSQFTISFSISYVNSEIDSHFVHADLKRFNIPCLSQTWKNIKFLLNI